MFLVRRFPKLRLLLLITHYFLIICCTVQVDRISHLTGMLATLKLVVAEFRAIAECRLLLLVAELRYLLLCLLLYFLWLSYRFKLLFVCLEILILLRVIQS